MAASSRVDAARHAVLLHDADCLISVMVALARGARDCMPDFFLASMVCRAWRAAVHEADLQIAGWHDVIWRVKGFSKI